MYTSQTVFMIHVAFKNVLTTCRTNLFSKRHQYRNISW